VLLFYSSLCFVIKDTIIILYTEGQRYFDVMSSLWLLYLIILITYRSVYSTDCNWQKKIAVRTVFSRR